MALGLKCGGTLEERASRLFGTKGKQLSELDPAMFAKSKPGPGKGGKNTRETEKQKEIASMESQVSHSNLHSLLFFIL
jgi:splicing factor 3A subunit 3